MAVLPLLLMVDVTVVVCDTAGTRSGPEYHQYISHQGQLLMSWLDGVEGIDWLRGQGLFSAVKLVRLGR